MKRLSASEARKKAKRAASAKKTAKRKQDEAADRAALATVPELLSAFQSRVEDGIKAAVKEGETRDYCYLGSWSWSDPRSRGAGAAATKLAALLRKDGYKVETRVSSAYDHVDGDGCPTDYESGSTSVGIEVDWGRSSESESEDDD